MCEPAVQSDIYAHSGKIANAFHSIPNVRSTMGRPFAIHVVAVKSVTTNTRVTDFAQWHLSRYVQRL